jgi:hypothetical protein
VPCLAAETAEDLTSHVYELQLATDRSLSARMADFDLGYQGSAIYRLDTGALLACDWTIAGRPAEAFYTNTTGSAIDLAVLNSHHTGSYSWHAAMHEFYLVEDGTTPGTWTQGVGTGGTMGSYFDTSLQSSVVQLTDNDTCGSRFDTAIDKGGVPCISLYYKKNYQCGSSNTIAVLLDTTSGWRWASYRFGTGTPYYDSANLTYFFYVGSLGTGQWHLLNRNMQQDLTSLSGPTITHTIGMSVWGQDMSVDDIRASACLRP